MAKILKAKFFVPGIAKGQGSLTSFKHPKTGAIVTPQNAKVKDWRSRIAVFAATNYDGQPMDCAVSVQCWFFLKRPKAHYNSKGIIKDAFAHARPAGKRNDIDKHVRAVLDALTGIIYDDDGRVTDIVASKYYETPTAQPGVEIQVFMEKDA